MAFQPLATFLASEDIEQDAAEHDEENRQGQRLGIFKTRKPQQPFHHLFPLTEFDEIIVVIFLEIDHGTEHLQVSNQGIQFGDVARVGIIVA